MQESKQEETKVITAGKQKVYPKCTLNKLFQSCRMFTMMSHSCLSKNNNNKATTKTTTINF